MLDLYDLIRNIERRPAMYLGQPDLSHLGSFLSGYFFARRQLGVLETEQEQKFSEFQAWIERKFNISSGQSWETIILLSSPDEPSALKQFFILFNEFSQINQPLSIAPLA